LQSLPVFDGIGLLVRGLADLAALLHRRKRGEESASGDDCDETAVGITLLRSFCTKGSLTDRATAVRALLEAVSATRFWAPLPEAAQLHELTSSHIDDLQKADEAEKREPGEAPPKRHRGKGQSPAEELLNATLDYWASTVQQCRKEVEDEGDLDPPTGTELKAFVHATLEEFLPGSLFMRLGIVRLWKHVFAHLESEKLSMRDRLDDETCSRVLAFVQDASLDQRSERLRRPALEFAAALAKDNASGGGQAVLQVALEKASSVEATCAATKILSLGDWLSKLDPVTFEQCTEQIAVLRAIEGYTKG